MESQINRLSRSGFALTSQAVDECDMYNKTHYAIWHNSRDPFGEIPPYPSADGQGAGPACTKPLKNLKTNS
jgi:hypothetical protein